MTLPFNPRLIAATLVVGFAPLLAPAASAQSAAPKLMLLGDSITQGANGYVGFRYPLYYDLQGGGVPFDYVGSETTGQPGTTPIASLYPNYNDAALFDNAHEGHFGYTTAQIINDGAGFTFAASAAAYRPDVLSIHLGTNDLQRGGASAANGYQPAVNNLSAVIDTARSANPNVRVLLSQIVPLRSTAEFGFGAVSGRVPGYNAAIAALASSKNTAASPVTVVDQFTGYDPVALNQPDGIHPNQYGEQLIADRYYRALQPVLAPGRPVTSPAIHLANPNFDDTPTNDGDVFPTPTSQGWTFTRTASSDGGIFNPTAASYAAAGGNDAPLGATGATAAYVFNGSDAAADGRSEVRQQLGATLAAGTDYALTVAVGNRLATNPYGTSYGGYEIELLAGGVVIASQADAMTPLAGTFADAALAVSADGLDPALLGGELSVRLRQTSAAASASTDFDTVRLTATAVPEPAAASLLIAGGALLARRRRPVRVAS